MFRFLPDYQFHRVTDIPPECLKALGVRAVLLDVDNTLAISGSQIPLDGLTRWLGALREVGIASAVFSNSGYSRVRPFAERIGVPYTARACKPLRFRYRRAARALGCAPGKVAIIGDQLFTDIWGGNRAGMVSILVAPILPESSPAFRLKRAVERRLLGRRLDIECRSQSEILKYRGNQD